MKDVIDHIDFTDGHLVGITTNYTSSKYSATWEPQSPVKCSVIAMRAFLNQNRRMAEAIQLVRGTLMRSVGVQGRIKFWGANQCDQQFGENRSSDIGKSQRLPKEGNVRITKMLAMWPHMAKLIEKVPIWRNIESPETDLHIAVNGCSIDYAGTGSLKQVHSLSKCQITSHITTNNGCENMQKFITGAASVSLPIMLVHPQVGKSIQNLVLTTHSSHHMLNWPSSSISWKMHGQSDTEPCGLLHSIRLLCIMLFQHTMRCLFIGIALSNFCLWRRLSGRKADTSQWHFLDGSWPNIIQKFVQWPVCFTFSHISYLFSWSRDRSRSGTRESILILGTRFSDYTQYEEVILKYVENQYSAKQRWLSINKPQRIPNDNLYSSAMASGSG